MTRTELDLIDACHAATLRALAGHPTPELTILLAQVAGLIAETAAAFAAEDLYHDCCDAA